MKNHINTLLIIITFYNYGLGQSFNSELPLSINTNGTSPHSTAILDIQSNNKGVLIPRMTTTQREAISSPADGLLVFDSTTGGFWFYVNQAWSELETSPSDPAWSSISGIPTDIADGDDNTQLSETEVDAMIANNGYLQVEGDSDPTNEIELPIGGNSGQILMINDLGVVSWQSPGNTQENQILHIPGAAFLPENSGANTGQYSLNNNGKSGTLPLIYPIVLKVGVHLDSLQFFYNPFAGSYNIAVVQKDILSGQEQILVTENPPSNVANQISTVIQVNHTVLENKIYRIKFSENSVGIGPPRIQAATLFYKE